VPIFVLYVFSVLSVAHCSWPYRRVSAAPSTSSGQASAAK
jgi:hypothetical protein